MPFVSGYLKVGQPGHPDQGLPDGESETDPGYGIEVGGGRPDNGLPTPPPVFPPPTPSHPIVIAPPGTPPGTIWPSPGTPDNALPGAPPGTPDNTLPSQVYWVVAGIPGYGWRYVAVDPSLKPGTPLPPHPEPKEDA